MIGGQVGIVGHLTIGNNVRIQAQSGIGRNIKDNEVFQGSPAFGYTDFNKSYVYFKNLPKLLANINEYRKRIKSNKNRNEQEAKNHKKRSFALTGVGLHTGNKVTITFKPAPVNNGLCFKRIDLEGEPVIEADAEYVVNTQRGTNLEKNGVIIQTSEHVLAAVGCFRY